MSPKRSYTKYRPKYIKKYRYKKQLTKYFELDINTYG